MDETFGRIVSILLIAIVLMVGKVAWVWSAESDRIDRKGCRLSNGCFDDKGRRHYEVYYLRNGEFAFPGQYVREGWNVRTYKNGKRIR